MNDASNQNFELPAPSKGVEVYSPEENSASKPEQGVSSKELLKDSSNSPNKESVAPIQPQAVSSPIVPISTTDDSASVGASSTSAQDADVIEKEWVDKAKRVVEATRNDPRAQNDQLAKVKAEYINARFQKKIKLSEDKK